ncbi:hypothetical protein AeRB84_013756 [Aphanomyces euteiches]|nr:hypothetical protein AeRB84_013756 [Aphanomyces euteiches]
MCNCDEGHLHLQSFPNDRPCMNPVCFNKHFDTILEEYDEDEDAFLSSIHVLNHFYSSIKHRRTRNGRAPSKRRDPLARHSRLVEQYFGDNPVYSDEDFRLRFRMSKPLFQRVIAAVKLDNDFFTQKVNAARKPGVPPLIKVTAALRMLTYGGSADAIDENLELSEATSLKSLKLFCESVIQCFGNEYLRDPNDRDIERLLAMNEKRGFVGMMGSIDCMHWAWNKCPTAFAGQYSGKEKNQP